jgi:hypothetical protein
MTELCYTCALETRATHADDAKCSKTLKNHVGDKSYSAKNAQSDKRWPIISPGDAMSVFSV